MSIFGKKRIYLDYAASTPVRKEVTKAMKPYFTDIFANPTSIHKEGQEAGKAVEESRAKIASLIKAASDEIIFTGNATEANNLAIFGVVEAFKKEFPGRTPHIITTKIEHHAVSAPIKKMEGWGARVTYLPVDENGLVKASDLKKELTEDTVLVSVIYANNEIGTVAPIKELSRVVRNYRREKKEAKQFPVIHSDCAQAVGHIPVAMDSLGLDMASFTAQKFYGPKGVGFLFKRRGVPLLPATLGGGQEAGFRSGTPNTPLIVGMARALELTLSGYEKEEERLRALQKYFFDEVLKIPGAVINGDREKRVASNINVSFPNVEGEQMVVELDVRGIAISSGSACTALSGERMSELVYAISGDEERARNAVRISMGKDTKKSDLDLVLKYAKEVIKKQEGLATGS